MFIYFSQEAQSQARFLNSGPRETPRVISINRLNANLSLLVHWDIGTDGHSLTGTDVQEISSPPAGQTMTSRDVSAGSFLFFLFSAIFVISFCSMEDSFAILLCVNLSCLFSWFPKINRIIKKKYYGKNICII